MHKLPQALFSLPPANNSRFHFCGFTQNVLKCSLSWLMYHPQAGNHFPSLSHTYTCLLTHGLNAKASHSCIIHAVLQRNLPEGNFKFYPCVLWVLYKLEGICVFISVCVRNSPRQSFLFKFIVLLGDLSVVMLLLYIYARSCSSTHLFIPEPSWSCLSLTSTLPLCLLIQISLPYSCMQAHMRLNALYHTYADYLSICLHRRCEEGRLPILNVISLMPTVQNSGRQDPVFSPVEGHHCCKTWNKHGWHVEWNGWWQYLNANENEVGFGEMWNVLHSRVVIWNHNVLSHATGFSLREGAGNETNGSLVCQFKLHKVDRNYIRRIWRSISICYSGALNLLQL